MSGRARALAARGVVILAAVTATLGVWKRLREDRDIASATSSSPPPGPAVGALSAPSHGPKRRERRPEPPADGGVFMFRGDAARRNRSDAAGPSEEPRALKTVELGGSIAATPIPAPGSDVIVATLSGRVARVTSAGEIAWSVELGAKIYGSPLVIKDLVVVGTDGDALFALSLADGVRRWMTSLGDDCDTSPAPGQNDTIVVAAGNVLYSVQLNGKVLWRVKATRKLRASPAVTEDGAIYVGSQDHHLYAVTSKGGVRWRRDLGAAVDCAAAIAEDGVVYAASDAGVVVALDPDGSERWRAELGHPVRVGMTLTRDGAVVASTSGTGAAIVALDGQTGAVRWTFPVPGREGRDVGAPLEDSEGRLFYGAGDGEVIALDRAGRLVWRRPVGAAVGAPLSLGADGALYVGAVNGNLYALR